jgi:NAD(P)-dependent dehydrogenase (short-subunit alcohol dehydrogenase family)
MDVTIDSHVRRVYHSALERFGAVDVIINNAGTRPRDLYPPHGAVTTLETEMGDWQKTLDSHLLGALRVIKQFAPPMQERRRGSIINVSAGGYDAVRPDTLEVTEKAVKAAVTSMTLYLAHELKPYNVAANVIVPGHTRTTGSDEEEATRFPIRAQAASPAPYLRPMRLTPDHVVPLALFLAEQDARGATGQIISALAWNQEHGLGGLDRWAYGPDREASDVRPPSPPR